MTWGRSCGPRRGHRGSWRSGGRTPSGLGLSTYLPIACHLRAPPPREDSPGTGFAPGHLRRFATPRRLPGQGQQHPLEQLVGLLVVLGDVGILVQAKHLRVGRDGEAPEVLDVGLGRKASADPRGALGARLGSRASPDPAQAGITLDRSTGHTLTHA